MIIHYYDTFMTFDSFDKTLIALFATSGGMSIISFVSVIGAPVGITSASLVLYFLSLQGS